MDTAHTSHCPHCFDALPSTPCAHCGWEPGADNPPPSLALGTLLDGRYRIGRVLGHGGFGITYLARDENLQLRLAIKEYLPRDCATRAPDGVSLAIYSGQAGEQFAYGLDRFLEEARALARFDQHPGIVTVKSFFRAHGTGYCVMDYVEGLTLKHYLERQPGGRIPVGQAWLLLQPVMDALRAVHKDGLLHRDLAPDNIYITRDGRVKLLDFGAARFAAGEHSRSLSIILKPGYAPEEQYRSRGKQGPWTDVYGLAATLYRAVTGTVPPEALDRLDQDDLVAPSRLGIAITAGQEAVLLKALAVKADARYPSMQGFQERWCEVESVKSTTMVSALPPPVSPKTPSVLAKPAKPEPERKTLSKRALPKSRSLPGLGLLLAFFVIVGLAFLLLKFPDSENLLLTALGGRDLSERLVQAHTDAVALAENDRARVSLERYLGAGQSALRNDDTEGARLTLRELEMARTILGQEYSLRIVNRPGERSGVWRIPDVNSGARNYYIMVEAVDQSGQVLRVPILNEETRETATVAVWGLRVDEDTFNAVARDKRDDGIIERDRFGYKARGELVPRYDMPTTGGAITRW